MAQPEIQGLDGLADLLPIQKDPQGEKTGYREHFRGVPEAVEKHFIEGVPERPDEEA